MDDKEALERLHQIMCDTLQKQLAFHELTSQPITEWHEPSLSNRFTPSLSGGSYFDLAESPYPIDVPLPPSERRKLLKRIK